ncbi:orexin/Hypocretin receptor type 1-like isoform X1 [Brevipalpus obovatus]|uniref:orexin/Hypocretin receptor type 1-like isoform X1 n=1 Tax=Brevipalpus obovatus TaxID=246614 RepID=UPI003D9F79B3
MNMDYSNPSDQESYDKELLDNLNSSALIAFIVNRTCGDNFQCKLELYEEYQRQYAAKFLDYFLCSLFIPEFIIGLGGNFLICLFIYRNHSMRTVTNYYIVNLAVADFLVILICLPPTAIMDLTKKWIFNDIMCKVVRYSQDVSVSVSVYTLTFISIDRWCAICRPLKFKSTMRRTRVNIFFIWAASMIVLSPELFYFAEKQNQELEIFNDFRQCDYMWSQETHQVYQVLVATFLYILPICFMSIAYYRIALVLWDKNIPGTTETTTYSADSYNNPTALNSTMISTRSRTLSVKMNTHKQNFSSSCIHQIQSRRKVAKTLIAVVIMFAICYLPVHILCLMAFVTNPVQDTTNSIFSYLSHLLVYANSAANPLIYNFMSGKFRREFRATFLSLCGLNDCRRKRRLASMSNIGRAQSINTQC